jgi:hypothetical protein
MPQSASVWGGLRPSIDAKLSRAEHHLGKLSEAIEGAAESDLLKTWTDRDRQGRVRVRVKEVGEIPMEWHVRIGECVYNMHTALDHLAYGLNIIGSGQDPPPNHRVSAFPIYADRRSYRGLSRARPAEALIKQFPRGARTRVERLQPYHGRKNDPFSTRRLGDLAELANVDKHRRFPVAAWSPKRLSIPPWVLPRRDFPWPVKAYTFQYRLLKPDTTIVWLEVPGLPLSIKEPKVDFAFTPQIEFVGAAANPPIPLLVPHEPVDFTLDNILRFIRERVLPEFERWVPA